MFILPLKFLILLLMLKGKLREAETHAQGHSVHQQGDRARMQVLLHSGPNTGLFTLHHIQALFTVRTRGEKECVGSTSNMSVS